MADMSDRREKMQMVELVRAAFREGFGFGYLRNSTEESSLETEEQAWIVSQSREALATKET